MNTKNKLKDFGFETNVYVTLSTSHLTQEDSKVYLNNPDLTSEELVIPTTYGFIVRTSLEEDIETFELPENKLSKNFISIVKFMKDASVSGVIFDADGPVSKLFKTFDW